MAEYTFRWPEGPQDVILTGDFDNWSGSLPLVKSPRGDFAITMPIPPSSKNKFHFKFIVDGQWMVSDNYDVDHSSEGIENNFLVVSSLPTPSSNKAAAAGGKIPEIGLNLVAPEVAAPVLGTQAPQKAQPAPRSNKKSKKKRIQIKRRIRRNKKTGERTVLSEERSELKSGTDDETYETEETATATNTSREDTPLSTDLDPLVNPTQRQNEFSSTVMPSTENRQTTLGEPGIAIVKDAAQIKEFSEIRDVDADELNERLNRELAEKQNREASTVEETPAEKETEPLKSADEGVHVSPPEFPVVEKNISPPEFPVVEKDLSSPAVKGGEEESSSKAPVAAFAAIPTGDHDVASESPVPESPTLKEESAPATLAAGKKDVKPLEASAAEEKGPKPALASGKQPVVAALPAPEKDTSSSKALVPENDDSSTRALAGDVSPAEVAAIATSPSALPVAEKEVEPSSAVSEEISTPLVSQKAAYADSTSGVALASEDKEDGSEAPAAAGIFAVEQKSFIPAAAGAGAVATTVAAVGAVEALPEEKDSSLKGNAFASSLDPIQGKSQKLFERDVSEEEPSTAGATKDTIDTFEAIEAPQQKGVAPIAVAEVDTVQDHSKKMPSNEFGTQPIDENAKPSKVVQEETIVAAPVTGLDESHPDTAEHVHAEKDFTETPIAEPKTGSGASQKSKVTSPANDYDIVVVEGELGKLPAKSSAADASAAISEAPASHEKPADVVEGVPKESELVPKESADAFESNVSSSEQKVNVVEEIGVITSPEQEAELIRKTLDPKASSPGETEELLIVEGDIPPSQIAEYQEASEAAAAKAMANQNPEEAVVREEPSTNAAPKEPVKETSNVAHAKKASPVKQKPAASSTSKPAEKEKKKKKGLFSKIKKIFH
ncbi:Mdg1p [Lachancea thermotolerans CBS 6340]|uniref:KLTH0B06864p n=1 Tax=Lachancea thermotolerans (strain ATCC 56472 / CBS 6340 / NRRL Y-8284) TaxID=559295 RepID=C5DCY6_LACTC|nr:KLTH0B06864p [Lachancea thermotolerans CBS 6340]CAR21647.1 KLTH0B06864p [Lachancea thermotolerans CBS 6340]